MHTLSLVVGGLVALGIFILAAVMLGRSVADGARVFIWPWLAVALINMFLGVYWANIPTAPRSRCWWWCSACRQRRRGLLRAGSAPGRWRKGSDPRNATSPWSPSQMEGLIPSRRRNVCLGATLRL